MALHYPPPVIYRASVDELVDLPLVGNTYGDVRLVRSSGCQFIWTSLNPAGIPGDWYPFCGTGGGGTTTDIATPCKISWFMS